MFRRAAVIAAGLAMATSFGLAGAGVASATTPTVHIKPSATWTLEENGAGCEQDTFNTTTHTFSSDHNSGGGWQFGGSSIFMLWNAGPGYNFGGTFVSTTTPVEFKGSFNGGPTFLKAKLVKGAIKFFHGFTC